MVINEIVEERGIGEQSARRDDGGEIGIALFGGQFGGLSGRLAGKRHEGLDEVLVGALGVTAIVSSHGDESAR